MGVKVCTAFEDMGVMPLADSDIDAELAGDETAADDFDRQHLPRPRSCGQRVARSQLKAGRLSSVSHFAVTLELPPFKGARGVSRTLAP